MYFSEVKLLLQYLAWKCKDAKTYFALSLVNKYSYGMTKYYSPMKRKEFCKEIEYSINYLYKKLYVLPNGRVLQCSSTALVDVHSVEVNECDKYFNVTNNTSVQTNTDDSTYYILKRNDYKHWEYFYHTRYYIVSPHYIEIKYISEKRYRYRLDGQRCDFCKGFHSFMLTNPHNNTQLFLLSSYCGLKLRYYYTLKSYEEHYKRTKVISSVIKYARQIR